MICEAYPRPWIVGPFGDIWVAADVEVRNGKWINTCPEPRLVVTLGLKDESLGALIVSAVNAASQEAPTQPQAGQVPVRRPVWLRHEGKHIVVLIEHNGQWREIIRERADGAFSHIWEDRAALSPTNPVVEAVETVARACK